MASGEGYEVTFMVQPSFHDGADPPRGAREPTLEETTRRAGYAARGVLRRLKVYAPSSSAKQLTIS
jgi:hypothetical protein